MARSYVTHYLHSCNNLAIPVERLSFTAAQVATTGDQLTADGVSITTARQLVDIWNKQYVQYGVTNYTYSLDVPVSQSLQEPEELVDPSQQPMTAADIHAIADYAASAWDSFDDTYGQFTSRHRRQFDLVCRTRAILRYDRTYAKIFSESSQR